MINIDNIDNKNKFLDVIIVLNSSLLEEYIIDDQLIRKDCVKYFVKRNIDKYW